MKIFILFVFFSFLFSFSASALSNRYNQFLVALDSSDFKESASILENWGDNSDKDPYFYFANFIFGLKKYKNNAILIEGLETMAPGMQSQLMYPRINSHKSIIFDLDSFPETRVQFTDAFYYDQRNLKSYILHLQEGIDKFPNFIKMRFMLMRYYENESDYESYIEQFKDFLVIYKDKNIKLVPCCERMVVDTKNHVFSILQNNFVRMSRDINSIYKKLFLHQYVNLLINYFPKKAEPFSNKGGLLARSLDDKKALKYFLKAYKRNKSDSIVLFNIAATYSNLKKFKKSLRFYKKALIHAHDNNEKIEIQNNIDVLTNYLNTKD